MPNYTDEDASGNIELADLPEREGAVLTTLYTMAEVECQACLKTIRVCDDQKGVQRANRFIVKHRSHAHLAAVSAKKSGA